MSASRSIQQQVMAWYDENWNSRVFPFFKRPMLTLETSLSTGKYPWSADDAMDILEDYFSRFSVDRQTFAFHSYWPNEETFIPINFLRSKENKWQWLEPKPLTLNMLVESAKAGRWLYD
ncbi:DUF1493 family protein [Erwinia sp. INIA-01]|uniref:DUF1493 family protein n=1 Tax=Erwinia sp. INIA01 TaxID=2991500 RepID=UPI0022240009|nr:DUF1493 family protein [Erwinia sp. INIA01]MCW1877327.1 DUF1493 family protein [Erwinia sp. INIA01]